MITCAFIIVYIYLLKILIKWERPSDELLSIVRVLFIESNRILTDFLV